MDELPKNIAAAPEPRPAARTLAPLPKTTPAKDPLKDLRRKALEGLGKKVRGFESSETKATYEVAPDGTESLRGRVVTRKHTPPDLPSIIFVLTNLDPANWRAKPTETQPQGEIMPDLSTLPDGVLRSLAEYIEEK